MKDRYCKGAVSRSPPESIPNTPPIPLTSRSPMTPVWLNLTVSSLTSGPSAADLSLPQGITFPAVPSQSPWLVPPHLLHLSALEGPGPGSCVSCSCSHTHATFCSLRVLGSIRMLITFRLGLLSEEIPAVCIHLPTEHILLDV